MKISICSDIHLEFGHYDIENNDNADVLVLAGDICVSRDFLNSGTVQVNIKDFFQKCSEQYRSVIYIMGNHEHYHGVFDSTVDTIKHELKQHDNIHVLEKEAVVIDDVTFLCQTLWTDFNKEDPVTIANCHSVMNDYRVIKVDEETRKKLTPFRTLQEHRTSIDFLKDNLVKLTDRKVVVVGHHAPSLNSVKPMYEHDYHINGAYRSDLEYIMNENPCIKLWIHGHTHENFDYTVNQTRVVCNPRGYVGYERRSQKDHPYYPLTVEI
jgi:predicted phosphodiesterase